jgi:sodium-dependent phosphate cotransporter
MKLTRETPAPLLSIILLGFISVFILNLYFLIQNFEIIFNHPVVAPFILETFDNPFASILAGALITTVISSSSIVIAITAIMVVVGLPFDAGIFLVMGANIGTSIRSGLVKSFPDCNIDDYRRMSTVSSMNYFINIIAFFILFPLQVSTDFLGRSSHAVVSWLTTHQPVWPVPIDNITYWSLYKLSETWFTDSPIMFLIILLVLLVIIMKLIFINLRLLLDPMINKYLSHQLDKLPTRGYEIRVMLTGLVTAMLLQSSSSTLYIMQPIVRKIRCECCSFFPLILGMNVGTCTTALIVALILNSELALAIGLAHLFYNLSVLIIFKFVPLIRELPILASRTLAWSSCGTEELTAEQQNPYPVARSKIKIK